MSLSTLTVVLMMAILAYLKNDEKKKIGHPRDGI
jgi:hypothetical protein